MSIINQIIRAAKQQGISQKTLASLSGLPAESISRAKRSESASLRTVHALARAAKVQIGIVAIKNHARTPATVSVADGKLSLQGFAQRHKSLVWSNPNASLETLLRAALVKPQFDRLLEAATEVGIKKLNSLWRGLQTHPSPEVLRAAPITNRILKHIQDGYQQAIA
ncbi:MAG: helix-turn-helix domain-containing protein [Rhodocyclaceae bacterium]|nr:helix-turn-helix domain-containing protein [Rhodocyclaceae bacterium]